MSSLQRVIAVVRSLGVTSKRSLHPTCGRRTGTRCRARRERAAHEADGARNRGAPARDRRRRRRVDPAPSRRACASSRRPARSAPKPDRGSGTGDSKDAAQGDSAASILDREPGGRELFRAGQAGRGAAAHHLRRRATHLRWWPGVRAPASSADSAAALTSAAASTSSTTASASSTAATEAPTTTAGSAPRHQARQRLRRRKPPTHRPSRPRRRRQEAPGVGAGRATSSGGTAGTRAARLRQGRTTARARLVRSR